jgi:putative membrane protein
MCFPSPHLEKSRRWGVIWLTSPGGDVRSTHVSTPSRLNLRGPAVRTILILVVPLAAVIFAVQNADVVTIDVLFWKLNASLAIVVALCVTAGTLLGALISVPRIYRMRAEQRRLRAQLADVDSSAISELSKAKVRSPQPR